jgi:hypothetical protein
MFSRNLSLLKKYIVISLIISHVSPLKTHAEEKEKKEKSELNEAHIFDARKNIPLSDNEPSYKDYYIYTNGDSRFKENIVVNVIRSVSLKNASGTTSMGDFSVPVGQLKVIAVQGKIAVARQVSLSNKESNPLLEQAGILAGDKIDFKGGALASAHPPKIDNKSDIKDENKPEVNAENKTEK